MNLRYKQKIFLYFLIVFVLFTAGVIAFEQKREKKYKTEILESKQGAYVEMIHRYIVQNNIDSGQMNRVKDVLSYFPSDFRITIIDESGKVLLDNGVDLPEKMENHVNRPEIKKAAVKPFGSDIRKSSSLNKEYIYYARHYDTYYIRVALPYDIAVRDFFQSDHVFLYFIVFLFLIALMVILLLSDRFGKSISRLKDFVGSAQDEDNSKLDAIVFPNDELGSIGKKIVELYKQINNNRQKIAMEREKLLLHFQSSQEGICFFSPEREKIYANSHFIQYLNVLTDKPTLHVNIIFEDTVFSEVHDFLNSRNAGLFATRIIKNGKHFDLRVVKFDDKSFEITISDITKTEKTRLMKQEMTNNIAHDLRTPVTSVRGYLETLKNQPDINVEKRQQFIDRAFSQIVRLSDLIQDIALITRMEEASEMFGKEDVKLLPLLNELHSDLSNKLADLNISCEIRVSDSVHLIGNRTLLYSVFRNLMDNSIAYGGEGIRVVVDNYMEDNDYYYFSYYDTGKGVSEKHLGRIFERFYRISEGRSSQTGGSGLGLSIVKNAILFHKGEVIAKNRKDGGLEFLFTLRKKI